MRLEKVTDDKNCDLIIKPVNYTELYYLLCGQSHVVLLLHYRFLIFIYSGFVCFVLCSLLGITQSIS